MRAGAKALSLLAAPLNVHVLETLAEESMPLVELRRSAGSPPQSTMRIYLRGLAELGVVERSPEEEFGSSPIYGLTRAGHALWGVGKTMQAWLDTAPAGPISLGSEPAKSAIKALVEGWSTNIVRALAAKPLSLTELNRLIPRISYPALERRLTAMRLADLAELQRGRGRMTPYRATTWLRLAVVPITSAIAWERRYAPEATTPVGRLDVEAAFLLAIPLMSPDGVSGKCRLAVEVQRTATPVFAGVLVCVEDGKVTSCLTDLEGEAEAWVSGSPLSWLRRMNGEDGHALEIGGDGRLAESILEALRRTSSYDQKPGE